MTTDLDLDSLLCDVAQIFDGWKQTAPKDWTDWDQSVRDRITSYRAKPEKRGGCYICGEDH